MVCVQNLHSKKKSVEWYLRSLWAKGFNINGIVPEDISDSLISYIKNEDIFLPESVSIHQNDAPYYRAAACHAAAHIMYGKQSFDSDKYNLLQRSIINLVEDLRIELSSIGNFPGLRGLWLAFHPVMNVDNVDAESLILRLSRSVLDPSYDDKNFWVKKGKQEILNLVEHDNAISDVGQVGLKLANDLGQMRVSLNSGRYQQSVIYRDDNSFMWHKNQDYQQKTEDVRPGLGVSHSNSKFEEDEEGITIPIAHESEPSGEGFLLVNEDGADLLYNEEQRSGQETLFHYSEWDYRTHIYKKDWCSVIEKVPQTGSLEKIESIHKQYKHIMARLLWVARKVYVEKIERQYKLEDGDEIDHDRMINAMVSIRSGYHPDVRVFMRHSSTKDKDIAISILVDLSESTNAFMPGTDIPISTCLRDSVLLLSEALEVSNEPFSVYGFCSDGRHCVMVDKFKAFSERFANIRHRLTTIQGGYSTRMGAAIRHCARDLAALPQRHKLLLVITDGVPSDIDVFDHRYLAEDSRHAIQELYRYQLKPFCINLDPGADDTIEHIFGKQRYETLDNISRLPEVLSRIYYKVTRS